MSQTNAFACFFCLFFLLFSCGVDFPSGTIHVQLVLDKLAHEEAYRVSIAWIKALHL